MDDDKTSTFLKEQFKNAKTIEERHYYADEIKNYRKILREREIIDRINSMSKVQFT